MFRLLHNPSLRKEMPSTTDQRVQKMKTHLALLLKGKHTSTLAYANALDHVYLNADYYTERILTLGTYYEKDNPAFCAALKYYIEMYVVLNYQRDIPLIKLASTVLPHINPKDAYWGPMCMKVIRDDDWVKKMGKRPQKEEKRKY